MDQTPGSLSKASTKEGIQPSRLPGSITQPKPGTSEVRRIIPGKETKTDIERQPGYKPEYAGVQPSRLPGSIQTPEVATAFIGTPSFREKAIPQLVNIQKGGVQLSKLQKTLQKGLEFQYNIYSQHLKPSVQFAQDLYNVKVDFNKQNDILSGIRERIGKADIHYPSWFKRSLLGVFGKKSTLEAIQKYQKIAMPYVEIGGEAGLEVGRQIYYTGASLKKGVPDVLAYSQLVKTYPVSKEQLKSQQKAEAELIGSPESQTTLIIGAFAGAEAIPVVGSYLVAAGTGYFFQKQLREYVKTPGDVTLATRTLLAGTFFLPPALRIARRGAIALTGEYVPASKIFAPEVIKGESTFPKTKSPQYTLMSFEKARQPQSLVKQYNRYLIKEFQQQPPKGSIIRAMPDTSLLPKLAVIKQIVPSYTKGGLIQTLHVTPSVFGKAETIGRGTSHEAGLYVTPYGKGSPYFTYLPEEFALPKLSLVPEFYNPEVIQIGIKGVKRYPRKVIETPGFEGVNIYLESQAGKGIAYVSKRSEARFNPALAKGFRPTGELEAIIPFGTKIISYVRGNILQKQLGFKTYTIYKGEFLPIKTYKLVKGKTVSPLEFLETQEGFIKASSSFREAVRPRITARIYPTKLEKQYPKEVYETYRPVVRPTVRPLIRPVVRPSARPVIRPVIRPVVRPAARPVTRPITRPVTRTPARPVIRPVVRPTERPITRPITRPVTRPNIRPLITPKQPPKVPPPIPLKKIHVPKIRKEKPVIKSQGVYAPSLAGIFGFLPKLEKVPKPSKSQIGLFSGLSLRPGVESKIKIRRTPTLRVGQIGIKRTVKRSYKKEKISKRGLPKWLIA